MKLLHGQWLLAVAALIGLAGCASIGPPLPPSLELPRAPSDLRAARKGGKVTLTWTIPAWTTDRQSVRYLGKTRVCRSVDAALAACDSPVGEVAPPVDFASKKDASGPKVAVSYTDILPPALQPRDGVAFATYAVEVLNRDGRGAGLSNRVVVPVAEALLPPSDLSARITAEGVVVAWAGEISPDAMAGSIRRAYRVFRRAEGSQQIILVGERAAGSEKNLSVTDQSFDWEKTYYYHADTLTVMAQPGKAEVSIEGDDTPEAKVFAHDVFPPAVPSGLQAVFSGPGQQVFIDLIWAPVTDSDLDGYNVYRHEEGTAPVKVNSELVKTPAFRDGQVLAGKSYFYAVSAVDQRGNESGKSEEAGERVP